MHNKKSHMSFGEGDKALLIRITSNKVFVDLVSFLTSLPKRLILAVADFLGVFLYSFHNCHSHWKRSVRLSVCQPVNLSVSLPACQQFLLITELRKPKY
jgi:hypothetical protein